MSRFKYKARGSSGQLLEGEEEALSSSDLSKRLISKNLTPVHIERKESGLDLGAVFLEVKKVKIRDLSIFFRQLSVVISAGVPLFEGLISIEEEASNPAMKKIITGIKNEIEAGGSFSSALSKAPSVFSRPLVAMVEAGERGGVLGEVLKRISASLEKENQFHSKIKSALRYPMIVITTLIIAFIISVVFIIPRFSAMFTTFKADLPLPTRFLMSINFLIINYWWAALICIAAAYYIFMRFIRSPYGGEMFDRFILRLPVFGALYTKLSLSRFFTMFADLLDSGVPLATALDLTARTSDNKAIAKIIIDLRQKVMEGSLLSSAMKNSVIFPSVAVHLVSLGERSGQLSEMFSKVSVYFDEDTDYMVSNMMSLLEPLFVLILGLFVLTLALGIFLPIWGMMNLYLK